MSAAAHDHAGEPAWWRDRRLWVGLAVIAAIGALLRGWNLAHGLPHLVQPDEPVIIERAQGILAGRLPDTYDWPTGGMLLLAGIVRVFRAVGVDLNGVDHIYLAGRVVFASISVALVVATGSLAASVADRPEWRRTTSWVAAALCAVGYTVVRLGREVQPDELQCLWVVVSLACTVRATRRSSLWWLAGGGLAAGAAAGAKYIGGVAVVSAIAAALTLTNRAWRARLAGAAAAAGGFAAGLLLSLPALVTKPGVVIDGVRGQFSHQAQGHLGYDGPSVAIGTHLFRLLPGNWGWAATILAVAGVVAVLVRGTIEQRLIALYSVVALAVVGSSMIRFPHYVLPVVPTLAVLASIAAHRVVARVATERLVTSIVVPVIALTLVPTALNDVRLLRADSATDTRTVAATAIAQLGTSHRVIKERYTDPASGNVGSDAPPSIAVAGDLASCDCYVVTSSYQEDRFRLDPDRSRTFVDAYDYVRAHGRVVAVIAPSRPLPYNWDTLPSYGMARIPLIGAVGLVGPTVTIYDLTHG